jgi:short-subunit dehydrogenase
VRSFLPLLDANPDGGHIVNTGSLSSLYGTRAQSAYGASKFAVGAFTEILAAELAGEGSKVGVSLLCPGPVRTNIGASARNRDGYAPSGRDAAAPDLHELSFRGDLPDDIWISADQAAAAVMSAVRAGDFWIITHPWLMGPVEARHAAIMAAANRPAG